VPAVGAPGEEIHVSSVDKESDITQYVPEPIQIKPEDQVEQYHEEVPPFPNIPQSLPDERIQSHSKTNIINNISVRNSNDEVDDDDFEDDPFEVDYTIINNAQKHARYAFA
jgi:hypothetical protein